ncbi:DUF3303 domain-containing protein [Rhodobacterales bacterium HKCCE2091]|nr:DUF3303 domain-containing protein [Rhodobacterales bacterium HKCCE2091]
MPRYMVIERFTDGPGPVYDRFHAMGRMLPEGLAYLDSWLTADGRSCYQLMETEAPALFADWTARWDDLATFEIVELGPKPEQGD